MAQIGRDHEPLWAVSLLPTWLDWFQAVVSLSIMTDGALWVGECLGCGVVVIPETCATSDSSPVTPGAASAGET